MNIASNCRIFAFTHQAFTRFVVIQQPASLAMMFDTVVRTGDLANHDNVAVAKAKRDTKDKGLRRCQVL